MTFRRFEATPVLALLLGLLLPVAVQAQIVDGEPPRGDGGADIGVSVYGPTDPRAAAIHAQTRETRNDVRDAVDAGRMSKRQGKSFKRQSRRIDAMATRPGSDGTLSASAARELDMASRALDSMANAPAARATEPKRKP